MDAKELQDITPEELLDEKSLEDMVDMLIHDIKPLKRRLQEIEALETMIAMQQNEIDALREENASDAEHIVRLMIYKDVKAVDVMDIRCYVKKL